MQLTADYLSRIARALECSPGDLMVSGIAMAETSEVEPASDPEGLPSLSDVLGQRGIKAYRKSSH